MERIGVTLPDAATVYNSDPVLERAVLGCIVNDPTNSYARLSSLSEEDFADDRNIKVYQALCTSWREKGTADLVSVGSYLLSTPDMIQYLADCCGAVGAGTEWDKSYRRLKEITAERKSHKAAIGYLNDLHQGKGDIANLILDLQQAQSHSISFEAYKCDAFFAEQMEDTDPLLMCRNEGIVYPADVCVVQGQAKTRKTTLLNAILAISSSGEPGLHFTPTKCLKTLVIDTEQSAYNLHKQGQRARMLGADFSKVSVFALRSVADSHRRLEYTLQAAHAYRPDIVIIDNVKDLVSDFNDLAESDRVVRQLMGLAEQLSCGIIAVIHENIDSEKARGHIGSLLKEKASTVIRTECTPEDKTVTKVTFPTVRNTPIEDFCFRLDEDVLPELVDYTPPGNYDELKDTFIEVFQEVEAGCRHKDLMDAVMRVTGKKISTAKTLIRQARHAQIIFVSQDKYYLSHGSNTG